jgi:hypothetical protein
MKSRIQSAGRHDTGVPMMNFNNDLRVGKSEELEPCRLESAAPKMA